MDNAGLMAPIPSRRRADYDERAARERGWGGLFTAVGEPLSYLPGPAGDVAQAAATVGREGMTPEGVLKALSEALMPRVLRRGPDKLSMYGRGKTKPGAGTIEEIRRDVTGPKARQYHGDTGEYIDVAGNVLGEFSDANMMPRKAFIDSIARQVARSGKGKFEGLAEDVYYHPELYSRFPRAKDVSVSVSVDPRYGSPKGQYSDNKILVQLPDLNQKPPAQIFGHEMEHYLQEAQGLPFGASVKEIRAGLVKSLKGRGMTDAELMKPEMQNAVNEAAWNRYRLVEGELGARGVEARRLWSPDELRKTLPTLSVRDAQGNPITSNQRILNPYEPWGIQQLANDLMRQGPLP